MAVPKAGREPLADLAAFLEPFAGLVRRSESRHALERYATGLLAETPDKTAAALGRVVPDTNAQQLQEFLTRTAWEPAVMDSLRIARMVPGASVGDGVVIIDETGFAKKGTHSVGVARQYSGTLGRVDNCQVLVTAHYVDRVFDWPITARLYLPEPWAHDRARCARAQVPAAVRFQTKGAIALDLLDQAHALGVPARTVVSDAGYGDQPTFLDGLEARRLAYCVAVPSTTRFRLDTALAADAGDPRVPYQGRGRPRKGPSLAQRVPSVEAAGLVAALPPRAWKTVAWRSGTKGALVKQCARVRVHRTAQRGAAHASHGWLLGERPLPGHTGDAKYYYASGLEARSLTELIELMHVRWVVERFYQDAKGELGLDAYEGRRWTGLHRHVALVMLAHSYLTLRQVYESEVRAPPRPPAKHRSPAPARGSPPRGAAASPHCGAPFSMNSSPKSSAASRRPERRDTI